MRCKSSKQTKELVETLATIMGDLYRNLCVPNYDAPRETVIEIIEIIIGYLTIINHNLLKEGADGKSLRDAVMSYSGGNMNFVSDRHSLAYHGNVDEMQSAMKKCMEVLYGK